MNQKKYRFLFLLFLLHLVFYGSVYLYLPFYVTVSLLLGEMGLVSVLNPRQILSERFEPLRRPCGYGFLGSAILIELSSLAHFPLWLWLVPVAIYLPFFLLKPLAIQKQKALWVSLIIGILYLGWMFQKIYPRYQNVALPFSEEPVPPSSLLPPPTTLSVEIPPLPPVNEPPPSSASGPLTNAIQEIDLKLKALEDENRQLKEKISSLEQKEEEHIKTLKERDQKIESLNQKLEEIRKLVQ